MSLNTPAATVLPGPSELTSTFWNTEVRDPINAIQDAWDSWTPTLTGHALGNGSVSGSYRRIGKTIEYRIYFAAGSLSTFTGQFSFSLPVTPHADYVINRSAIGSAFLIDNSAAVASRAGATVFRSSANGASIVVDSLASSATVNDTVPWTWATGDSYAAQGTYEAA